MIRLAIFGYAAGQASNTEVRSRLRKTGHCRSRLRFPVEGSTLQTSVEVGNITDERPPRPACEGGLRWTAFMDSGSRHNFAPATRKRASWHFFKKTAALGSRFSTLLPRSWG